MHENVVGSAWGGVEPRSISERPTSTAEGHPPKGRVPKRLLVRPFRSKGAGKKSFVDCETPTRYSTNEATIISRLLEVAMDGVDSIKATVKRHDSDKRAQTPGAIKNSENEANQLYRAVPRVAIGGVGAFMTTITPHENDLSERDARRSAKTAKTKPINCIDGAASSDRREWSC